MSSKALAHSTTYARLFAAGSLGLLFSASTAHADRLVEASAGPATMFLFAACDAGGGVCDRPRAEGIGLRIAVGIEKKLSPSSTLNFAAESLIVGVNDRARGGSLLGTVSFHSHHGSVFVDVGAGLGVLWVDDPTISELSYYGGLQTAPGVGLLAAIGFDLSRRVSLSLRADGQASGDLLGGSFALNLQWKW